MQNDHSSSTHKYSVGEELANSLTHGLGFILALAGLTILVVFAALYGNARHIVACSIYGAMLVILYTASTLYHSLTSPRAKAFFQVIDHAAIFLLIAGTYTPFTLVTLRGGWGWSLFGVIWGFAILGILLQVTALRQVTWLMLILYTSMGWIVVIALKPLLAALATGGLVFLILGGLMYTLGIIFYVRKSIRFSHAVWHLFVLAGSILHFFAILFFVIP